MREILFRGKRIDNGEWVEGFYYKAKYYKTDTELSDYITIPHPDEMYRGSDHILVEPETVGQFTGLYDKYGKRIFEGDIINCYTLSRVRDYENSVVRWNEVLLCFMAGRNSLYGGHAADIYEVIGNIHDNPELLEGKI